ncbi:Sulfide dehydrogenase flavocytochrome c flavoprotein chain [Tepidimonas alkaliphilus]|uniref:Sulfide dehydrogenase flavocytochrome c flavoprotein chain n=1 Tax=Tepidimonas alkaliphilus TaxID=2588942 RepID=A0A554WDP6_9BURK|nr:NAD(P)/FAD-dependent oxidoreductase [Tepidimonas alkaliphilus]TSE21686.1 Sulfide dehydrogenase flavocytochrome c flavoprotein chain [Tepidimonas alkaliphilus]
MTDILHPAACSTRRAWMARALGLLAATAAPTLAFANDKARIVVVGGGVGGATAAKYLKLFNPALDVTVIERNPIYIRPYGSSEVLTEHITMRDLEVRYDTLRDKYGIRFVFDAAVALDPVARVVTTAGKQRIGYDRLIVSPGIELLYDAYPGYSEQVARTAVPSGWIPGEQTALLAQQLKAMRPGGLFVLAAPPNPYRCPPGPYERAALVTEWLLQRNPTAKVIIADPKDAFVTDETMMLGWNRLYGFNLPEDYAKKMADKVELKTHSKPSMISWIRGKDGGRPLKLDAKRMRLETEGETIQADVINIIPPMRAGAIARAFGLTDSSGFCPIERRTFASTLVPNVHVIGDASIADAMPKSGFSANTQAKVVARAIVEELAGRKAPEPLWENTCYALAGKDYGLFVADVFRILPDGKIGRVNGKERYLPLDASPVQIRLGARYQQAWLRTFTQDCFA